MRLDRTKRQRKCSTRSTKESHVPFDLLIKGGHVLDPGQGLGGVLDLGIEGSTITAVAADLPPDQAAQVIDAGGPGRYVVPGLIDIHTHDQQRPDRLRRRLPQPGRVHGQVHGDRLFAVRRRAADHDERGRRHRPVRRAGRPRGRPRGGRDDPRRRRGRLHLPRHHRHDVHRTTRHRAVQTVRAGRLFAPRTPPPSAGPSRRSSTPGAPRRMRVASARNWVWPPPTSRPQRACRRGSRTAMR